MIRDVCKEQSGETIHVASGTTDALRAGINRYTQLVLEMAGSITRDVKGQAITSAADLAFGLDRVQRQAGPRWNESAIPMIIRPSIPASGRGGAGGAAAEDE
jgi:hypothetical protein